MGSIRGRIRVYVPPDCRKIRERVYGGLNTWPYNITSSNRPWTPFALKFLPALVPPLLWICFYFSIYHGFLFWLPAA